MTTTKTIATSTALLPAILLATALGLTACGGDDGAPSAAAGGGTAADPTPAETPAETPTEAPADVEPGSPEQIDAIAACLTDLGLDAGRPTAVQRPEHVLAFGPLADGPDRGLEGQIYVFDSQRTAEQERPNVTFFDEDTRFDSLIGNVLAVYYLAPSRAGGLEAGIDACLA